MERGLRDCCRSIRIGKMLIQCDDDKKEAKVYYAKLPPDISRRNVLLMYPILSMCDHHSILIANFSFQLQCLFCLPMKNETSIHSRFLLFVFSHGILCYRGYKNNTAFKELMFQNWLIKGCHSSVVVSLSDMFQ